MVEAFRFRSCRRMSSCIKVTKCGERHLVHITVHCLSVVCQQQDPDSRFIIVQLVKYDLFVNLCAEYTAFRSSSIVSLTALLPSRISLPARLLLLVLAQ